MIIMQKDDDEDDVQTKKSLINTPKSIKTEEAKDQRSSRQHEQGIRDLWSVFQEKTRNAVKYNKLRKKKDKTGTSI